MTKPSTVPKELYPAVLAFLETSNFLTSANAFRREAKKFLKNSTAPDSSLSDIFQAWKTEQLSTVNSSEVSTECFTSINGVIQGGRGRVSQWFVLIFYNFLLMIRAHPLDPPLYPMMRIRKWRRPRTLLQLAPLHPLRILHPHLQRILKMRRRRKIIKGKLR